MKSRLPSWFKQEIPEGSLIKSRVEFLKGLGLNTVCQSARCPNLSHCFKRDTATFMILGDVCTRNCRFCAVKKGLSASALMADEPDNIVVAAEKLGLKYIVITSVSRDDLDDGGAAHFALVVDKLHREFAGIKIEVLIPDFKGEIENLKMVLKVRPDVVGHNLETVSRLYPAVRPQADYWRSLELLRRIKEIDASIITKSGIMAGLGEGEDEVVELMKDLRRVDCDILTVGQYLAPSPGHLPVERFVPPAEFLKLGQAARSLGFKQVSCGPLVRSSYHSEEIFAAVLKRKKLFNADMRKSNAD